MVEKLFLKAIKDYSLINPNDRVLVAFSGGPDSVALTYLFYKFKDFLKLDRIVLAHLNHSLREEADLDESFSKSFGEKYGIPVFTKKVDVRCIAKKNRISIEEAGRLERYKFFQEVMQNQNLNKLATAHHLSDLVETMFLWFIQGSKRGLKGFKPKEGNIIRPLYFVKKEDILDFCQKNALEYVIDKTNFDRRYVRNKVRLDIVPLAKSVNIALEESLLRLSYFENLDEDFLDSYSKEILSKLKGKNYIDLNMIKDYHDTVKYRVIRDWIYENFGLHLSYEKLIKVLSIIKTGGTKMISLEKDVKLIKEYDRLFVRNLEDVENFDKEYKLKIGDTIFIKEAGITLTAFKPERVVFETLKNDKTVECFNLQAEEFTVRFKRDGDRFLPFGRKTEKKLKDIFIDLKIPKNMRKSIPLLVFNDKILWIVGYKRSAYYPVDENSQNLVCFKVKEEQSCS
ncbi:MAG: tRNA lysidine(34) synthetase TilS [Sulfurihydrogenibium sp.]